MKFPKTYENLQCKDILQCVLNLNELDISIYKKLKETNEIRADTLSKQMNKERSTIYRSLQKLTNCGLCTKTTKTIETGGYYHTYSCNDTKKIKNQLETCIDEWYKHMKKTIKEFKEI